MSLVFRAMRKAHDGLPAVGPHALALGVRRDIDIPVSENGVVEPGSGGMSVSRSLEELPHHRRPRNVPGGKCDHPGWVMESNDLPDFLRAQKDSESHAFIEPAYPMELGDYEDALASTRELWEECR